MPYRTASEVLPLIVTRGTGLVVSVILNVCEDSLPFHSLSGRTVRMKPESLLFATRHAKSISTFVMAFKCFCSSCTANITGSSGCAGIKIRPNALPLSIRFAPDEIAVVTISSIVSHFLNILNLSLL